MNSERSRGLKCAICGTETNGQSTWFLITQNRWLDRIRILSWHPLLASRNGTFGVCGAGHLRDFITRWVSDGDGCLPLAREHHTSSQAVLHEPDLSSLSASNLLGELAIQRETPSGLWTGSPETLESILEALPPAPEPQSEVIHFPPPSFPSEVIQEVAIQ